VGTPTQVVYHGGPVMAGGVTVHEIFWDGGTNPFPASPNPGASVPSYEGLIEQFFSDIHSAETGTSGASGACTTSTQADCNVFTVLPQYAEGTSPGSITSGAYTINVATPIIDTDAYPAKSIQCQSPDDTPVCVTDGQIQTEIDSEITNTGGSRGLNNLWFVFLPPGVDPCILPGECGTNAFAAYHSDYDDGNGVTVYAVAIDPVIEAGPISPGSDPQGNPDAEATANAAGHETVEAITDPQGDAWMDPNGFEVADKCETAHADGRDLSDHGRCGGSAERRHCADRRRERRADGYHAARGRQHGADVG
jgi:hypothetical protein